MNGTGPAAELGAAGGTRTTDRVVVPAAAAETRGEVKAAFEGPEGGLTAGRRGPVGLGRSGLV